MFNKTVFVTAMIMTLILSLDFPAAEPQSKALQEAIARASWFEDLNKEEKESLRTVATLRRCKVGERIIEQGKSTKKIFVVLDGKADVLVNGKVIATLAGEFFVGEIEYLDMNPASADVVIQQDCDVIEIGNMALASLMDKEPRIGYVLMAELARIEAQRLRDTTARWGLGVKAQ